MSLPSKRTNLSSKKGRQEALRTKLAEIEARLADLKVSDIKYLLSSAVTNPETPQNSVRIESSTDTNWLIRTLAYYRNILAYHRQFCKDADLELFPVYNIGGVAVADIVRDIERRLFELAHMKEIQRLQAIKEELLPFVDEESRFAEALRKVDGLLKQQ